MTFASEASKLLTNKYFLYFIAFLAISNVVGYLVTNKLNAVIFFVLVCILAYNFSKNMTVVLIIAIVTTNLMMVNKSMIEGFKEGEENMDAEGAEGARCAEGRGAGGSGGQACPQGACPQGACQGRHEGRSEARTGQEGTGQEGTGQEGTG